MKRTRPLDLLERRRARVLRARRSALSDTRIFIWRRVRVARSLSGWNRLIVTRGVRARASVEFNRVAAARPAFAAASIAALTLIVENACHELPAANRSSVAIR